MEHAERTARRAQVWGVLLATLLAIGLTIVYARATVPFDDGLASCLPVDCFNERVGDAAVLQPSATWSSLAFAAAGGLLLSWRLVRTRSGVGEPITSFALGSLGVISFLVGMGSAAYHARLTFLGQTADVFGMNLLALQVACFSLLLRGRAGLAGTRLLLVALGLVSLVVVVVLPDLRRPLFAVLLAVALVMEVSRSGGPAALRRGRLGLGLAVFVVGYAFWVLDDLGIWFSRTSVLQGHSIWHVAGAVAVVLLAQHEVSSVGSLRSGSEPAYGVRTSIRRTRTPR